MKLAIFADIHGNLEALETAFSHAQSQKVDSYILLGDAVGYGANPDECFEWGRKHARVFLMGNHEKAVVDLTLRNWFNPVARDAIVWTEQNMKPDLKEQIKELPYVRIESEMTFVHGSLEEPEAFNYLLSFSDAEATFRKMGTPVCFAGHTHVPSCFSENDRRAWRLPSGVFKLASGKRYILNPGAVGQPRDRDPRLSCGIYDSSKLTFEILRLEYDNVRAADKIRKAGLPRYLADRLL